MSALIGLRVDPAYVESVAERLAAMEEVQYSAVTTGAFDVFLSCGAELSTGVVGLSQEPCGRDRRRPPDGDVRQSFGEEERDGLRSLGVGVAKPVSTLALSLIELDWPSKRGRMTPMVEH